MSLWADQYVRHDAIGGKFHRLEALTPGDLIGTNSGRLDGHRVTATRFLQSAKPVEAVSLRG